MDVGIILAKSPNLAWNGVGMAETLPKSSKFRGVFEEVQKSPKRWIVWNLCFKVGNGFPCNIVLIFGSLNPRLSYHVKINVLISCYNRRECMYIKHIRFGSISEQNYFTQEKPEKVLRE